MNLAAVGSCLDRVGLQDELHSLGFHKTLHLFRDVLVLVRQDAATGVNDCDPASEALEHLTELQPDIPAAQYEKLTRHFLKLNHLHVRQIWRFGQPLNAGNGRSSASIDEDALRLEEG